MKGVNNPKINSQVFKFSSIKLIFELKLWFWRVGFFFFLVCFGCLVFFFSYPGVASTTCCRRSFITAGAGAGIASVFRAPIGGLLFTLEEVSSFWDIRLAWQTFFCCLTATFTTDLLSSSLYGFVFRGHFGFFEAEKRILFWVRTAWMWKEWDAGF